MINVYIDESGSMTTEYCNYFPYFVISILVVNNKEKLRKAYKRFISKYKVELKALDRKEDKMFCGDKFVELKGSVMNRHMKKIFMDYFCRNELFSVYYIRISNKNIRYGLFSNTARAFNFVLKQGIEYFLLQGLLKKDDYTLHIDERNQKTKTKYFLEEYLNTELSLKKHIMDSALVKYYDSQDNQLIQLADVFSNIFYSYCLNKTYAKELSNLYMKGYVKGIYDYP